MLGKYFKHLTWDDRVSIASYLKVRTPIKEIAKLIGVSKTTIYNELERGQYLKLCRKTLKEFKEYSPDIAEEKYRNNLSQKGRDLKIGKDIKFANFIEDMIVNKKYSPKAVLFHVKQEKVKFKTSICFKTLYNYIENNVFYRLTNKDLPIKRSKKRGYSKVRKRSKIFGDSIEKRPSEIEERNTFGHWEMDCVIGKQEKGKTLLVLTERFTRFEIIKIMEKKKVENVVKALDEIEKELGFKKFRKIFNTITVDNGSEFAGGEKFEQSCISKKKRTKVYFCHPYSSWERGSNENNNKLIRRHLPKGTSFKCLIKEEVKYIEEWMNNYPREMFKGRSSKKIFDEELEKLNIVI